MRAYPILFTGEMVQAILAGRKGMTRRLRGLAGVNQAPERYRLDFLHDYGEDRLRVMAFFTDLQTGELLPGVRAPYGGPGDGLWVRETWRVGAWDDYCVCLDYRADNFARRKWLAPTDDVASRLREETIADARAAGLTADSWGTYQWAPGEGPGRWRPSIFMPRWACRIELMVEEVRVERLSAITEAAAVLEGVRRLFTQDELDHTRGCVGKRPEDFGWMNYLWHGHADVSEKQAAGWRHQFSGYSDARNSFFSLWEKINGKKGLGVAVDPWVWVYRFGRRGA